MNGTYTIKRAHVGYAVAGLVVLVLLLITTGCAKFAEPFKDAPTAGHNGSAALVIEQPDGFSNAAEKCDGFGHLIITTYHGDKAYAAVAVINDSRCGSLSAPLPFGH
jgi:hypothetical protein